MRDNKRLAVAARMIPKLGLSAEQCEDAWAANASAGRFAVADGATDSYASGRLARLMVEGFVEEAGPRSADELAPWARSRAEAWSEATPVAGLPWYKQEKARLGAHCTFLGVQLERPDRRADPIERPEGTPAPDDDSATGVEHDGAGPMDAVSAVPTTYRAFAVGDVCLFHVREDQLLSVMPVSRPEDFGVQPALIATSRSYPGPGLETLVEWTGEILAGDLLLLASDALAHWMVARAQEGERPWRTVVEASEDEFAMLVARLRNEDQMRNDDVTLLTLAAAPLPPPVEAPPPTGARRVPRRGRAKARRQVSRAVAVSLGAGALLLAVALLRAPKAKGQAGSLGADW